MTTIDRFTVLSSSKFTDCFLKQKISLTGDAFKCTELVESSTTGLGLGAEELQGLKSWGTKRLNKAESPNAEKKPKSKTANLMVTSPVSEAAIRNVKVELEFDHVPQPNPPPNSNASTGLSLEPNTSTSLDLEPTITTSLGLEPKLELVTCRLAGRPDVTTQSDSSSLSLLPYYTYNSSHIQEGTDTPRPIARQGIFDRTSASGTEMEWSSDESASIHSTKAAADVDAFHIAIKPSAKSPLPVKNFIKKGVWSEEEYGCLMEGVERFGEGKWKEIRTEYYSVLQHRTTSQLKDKYRNIKGRTKLVTEKQY